MLGGSLALAAAASASVATTIHAAASGRRPPSWALAGTVACATYAVAIHPWLRTWGADADELEKPLPGDDLVLGNASQTTRAVTIDASVDEVWPWLAQIGQDRGGLYSYEWLENLAGCRMRNAASVHPEWQERDIGDTVFLHWAHGLKVARFEPKRMLALEGWGAFVLEPLTGDRTRLIARGRMKGGPARWLYTVLLEIPHFLMERKMLLGIRDRAESMQEPAV